VIHGIRTHEDYWKELISEWPPTVHPVQLEIMQNMFYAGFALSSSFMGDIKRSTITREEKVAVHTFCMSECLRLSGLGNKLNFRREARSKSGSHNRGCKKAATEAGRCEDIRTNRD
jgi:hypothetical protein